MRGPILYTDADRQVCDWTANLIAAGRLPPGDVLCADIAEADFAGYRSVHAFNGIGGWPLAAMLAEWPDDLSLWTASLPCQPFSTAGQMRGVADDRHLWPAFLRRVREQAPPVVAGEQVAGTLGREWIAGVRDDLEEAGYAVGVAVLPACAVASPHKRERLYWVAIAAERLGDPDRDGLVPGGFDERGRGEPGADGLPPALRLGHPDGLRFFSWRAPLGEEAPASEGEGDADDRCELVPCADGVLRRVPTESGLRPLTDGVPARVVRIRAYGNAIIPELAAIFLLAVKGLLAR